MADAELRRITRERDEARRERDTYRAAWHQAVDRADKAEAAERDAVVQRGRWEREVIDLGNRLALAEAQLAAYGPVAPPTRPQDGRTPVPATPGQPDAEIGDHTTAQTITPTDHA